MKCTKLHVWSFGLSLGIIWGLYLFVLGLLAMGGMGVTMVETMRTMYIGYTSTFLGSIIGGIWGFVDMFIFGVLVAWVYNFFLCRFGCGEGKCEDKKVQ